MESKKIRSIFRKIAWLDTNRWKPHEQQTNYNPINFSSLNLSNSEKILTHWLCYISDRQMSFSQIWDKGGFVYSDIVNAYFNGDNTLEILDPNLLNSFFQKRGGDKYSFRSKTKIPLKNKLISNYRYSVGNNVEFIPRYYPSDLKSILQTLLILENYNRDIIKYIAAIIDKRKGQSVKVIGFALYLLSYHNIGQPKSINFDTISRDAHSNKSRVLEILNNDDIFDKEFKSFLKDRLFRQKRMWCSLRDYIKSDEFLKYVVGGLKDINRADLIPAWRNLNVEDLELPGDVWNNNPKFSKCLFGDMAQTDKATFNSSKFIRKIFSDNESEITEGYPEMFDVTFDFVPRMCNQDFCDFCIFNDNNKIAELCVQNENKYCPVLLVSCGYKSRCDTKNCVVLKNEK